MTLNAELLQKYAACTDSAAVVQVQNDWIAMCQIERETAQTFAYGEDMLGAHEQAPRDFPPSESSSEEG